MGRFVRLFLHASCAALSVPLMFMLESTVHAQVRAGSGVVIAVDVTKSTLMLETSNGLQPVLVASTATIRGDHGTVLTLADLQPGDAVSYHTISGAANRLQIARQFWSLPSE